MDQEQIERLEHLLVLFHQRTKTFDEFTSEIIHTIGDPVVRVLCDILEVEEDSISWDEVEISSPLIALRFQVVYGDGEKHPEFLDVISPITNNDEPNVRQMVLAFPLIYTTATYDEFKEFMMSTIKDAMSKRGKLVDESLTREQQLQVYLHRPTRKVNH